MIYVILSQRQNQDGMFLTIPILASFFKQDAINETRRLNSLEAEDDEFYFIEEVKEFDEL